MLKAVPRTWSYTFSVMDDGRNPVAQAVDLSWWCDKAEIRIQDTTYLARRRKRAYVLESTTGTALARAERPRALLRQFTIRHDGHEYSLRAKSAFSREFLLFERATRLGSLSPQSVFSRKANVNLPQDLPVHLQVFIIWVVMTLWKHDEAAAVAASVVIPAGAG